MNVNISQWFSSISLPSHGRGHRFNPCRAHHFQGLSGPLGKYWRGIGALTLSIATLATPAHADPLADLVAVHVQMRAGSYAPQTEWVPASGDPLTGDCKGWSLWGRNELARLGIPSVVFIGPDPYIPGGWHAVVCTAIIRGRWTCLDRRESTLQALAAYGPGWRIAGQ